MIGVRENESSNRQKIMTEAECLAFDEKSKIKCEYNDIVELNSVIMQNFAEDDLFEVE